MQSTTTSAGRPGPARSAVCVVRQSACAFRQGPACLSTIASPQEPGKRSQQNPRNCTPHAENEAPTVHVCPGMWPRMSTSWTSTHYASSRTSSPCQKRSVCVLTCGRASGDGIHNHLLEVLVLPEARHVRVAQGLHIPVVQVVTAHRQAQAGRHEPCAKSTLAEQACAAQASRHTHIHTHTLAEQACTAHR